MDEVTGSVLDGWQIDVTLNRFGMHYAWHRALFNLTLKFVRYVLVNATKPTKFTSACSRLTGV